MATVHRALLLVAALVLSSPTLAPAQRFAEQGADWTEGARDRFYTQDQGSRIMPLAWMEALTLPDGSGFLADRLERYGYLAKPEDTRPEIPVGFTVAEWKGTPMIGMTCSACHTREIVIEGEAWRIDGGPAIVDFQAFLSDLDSAVGRVLDDDAAMDAFARSVLGPDHAQHNAAALRLQVEAWYLRYHTLMDRALPDDPWGPSRLDAVSMIFNRVAGLDIGPPPSYLIPENIARADAPTRYPFLWNAARQDKTQWPGFADNGDDVLGLARNLGEVYGVFAIFHPRESLLLGTDYLGENSANFAGLRALEDLIWKIGPPKWPLPLDDAKVAAGKVLFDRPKEQGGCKECHQIRKGERRLTLKDTWATPIQDVGTDTRECGILTREVKTGVLEGSRIPLITERLKPTDTAFNVLRTAVIGAIAQDFLFGQPGGVRTAAAVGTEALPPELEALKGAFRYDRFEDQRRSVTAAAPGCRYEARVLEGIWAAAPYLHNGSVPTLEDLLKPPAERPDSFAIGPMYDMEKVGLAKHQDRFGFTLETTGCDDVNSGKSKCGHDYGGAHLTEEERSDLLEYLKSL